jgi:hypothetical protein
MMRFKKILMDNNVPCEMGEYSTGYRDSSGVVCQCSANTLGSLPEFVFEVGDYNFQLEPKAYMVLNDSTLPKDEVQDCYMQIAFNKNTDRYILGAPFMR